MKFVKIVGRFFARVGKAIWNGMVALSEAAYAQRETEIKAVHEESVRQTNLDDNRVFLDAMINPTEFAEKLKLRKASEAWLNGEYFGTSFADANTLADWEVDSFGRVMRKSRVYA
jgi:hypothetical protein